MCVCVGGVGEMRGPAAIFLSRANQTCQKASSRAAMATALAPAKVTRWSVFPSRWAAVMSDTQLKPHAHTHRNTQIQSVKRRKI